MNKRRLSSLRAEYSSKIFLSILKSILIIIPLPMIILIVVELFSLHTIEDTILEFENILFAEMGDELGNSYENAYQVMYDIKKDEELVQYLREEDRNYYSEYQILKTLNRTLNQNNSLEEIYIYFPRYDYILSTQSGMSSQEYHRKNIGIDYQEWIETLKRDRPEQISLETDAEGESVLISSLDYERREAARIVVRLKRSYLEERLESLCFGEEGRAYIIYKDQMLAASTGERQRELAGRLEQARESGERTMEIEGRRYFLKMRAVSKKGPILVCAIPEGLPYLAMKMTMYLGVGAVILCGLVLAGAAILATNHNYAPIKRLFTILKEEDGVLGEMDYGAMETYAENARNQMRQLRLKLDRYESDVKNLYMGKMLLADPTRPVSEEEMKEWGFSGRFYVVAMYAFDGVDAGKGQEDYRKDVVVEYVKEYIKNAVCCYAMEKNNRVYCVLNGGLEEEEFCTGIRTANEELTASLAEVEKLYCDSYLSRPFSQVGEIGEGYLEVNQARKRQTILEEEQKNNCSIEKIEEKIKENLSDGNLSIASLAELLHITPSYLSRFFKKNTEKGVLEYIHESRIGLAKELMQKDREIKIKEVAETAGFSNLATFIRVFKKIEGITPGQFRESILDKE